MPKKIKSADLNATQQHILKASQELLLASHGVLSFCRQYAEKCVLGSRRKEMLDFFSKSLSVVNELVTDFSKSEGQEQKGGKHVKKRTKNH
ncbi:MAG: hypothetical protein HY540_08045 [Deltaproteobacteria bacterium]|nr:hypothetical protein [Deltaproteobacteria bacterium]